MSGIVGTINLDGTPIDRDLLQQMTDFMRDRGPDAQEIWVNGHVGLGHAMLRTTIESANEQQPCSLEGQVWITADARVDARSELIEKLQAQGCQRLKTSTDVELILHAYQVWGEDCCEHLLGDFAFAIWDGKKQRLFCARDRFGVKPFYYAQVGNRLIFSNTLNCVRLHPGVSERLNDLAIADFLLFGCNQEVNTTAFADIQRLMAAHCLTVSRQGVHLKRYWTLPIEGYIYYKRSSDYVDHFKALMQTAVSDRLRTDKVSVAMSGGLDSTTIAALAKDLLHQKSKPFDLRAFTIVYDRLIPDRERYYSGLVADALGIPIHYLSADNYTLFEQVEQLSLRRPEPINFSLLAIPVDQFKQIAAHSRVVLNGNGGDPVFYSWGAYFHVVHLLKNLQFGRLVTDLVQYRLAQGRFPQPGLRSRVKKWLGIRAPLHNYPRWINPQLSAKLDLQTRWKEFYREKPLIHPLRPEAYQQMTASMWSYLFENSDPGETGFPVEVRYPFFDLRLVNYLLAIPPVPWCLHKELMRQAMRGILPEEVRLRPKTPMQGDPLSVLLGQPEAQWVDRFEATPALANYVNREAVPLVSGRAQGTNAACINLHPLNLNYWLQKLEQVNNQLTNYENYANKS